MKTVCMLLVSCLAFAPAQAGEKEDRELIYGLATKIVTKGLKAPATAKFSRLGADEEARLEAMGNKVFEAAGFVDSQNSFGALLRSRWEIVFRVKDRTAEPLYFLFGDEVVHGSPEDARAISRGLDPKTGEMEGLSPSEVNAARRQRYHRQARELTLNLLPEGAQPRHSTLGNADDKFTSCREVTRGFWEAKGVLDIGTSTAPRRISWAGYIFNDEVIYLEVGKNSKGDRERALKLLNR